MYYCSVFRRTAALPEVEQFALRLEDSHWNYGECDNDVVIVYSAGDNVVSYLSWYLDCLPNNVLWVFSADISILSQCLLVRIVSYLKADILILQCILISVSQCVLLSQLTSQCCLTVYWQCVELSQPMFDFPLLYVLPIILGLCDYYVYFKH